MSKQGEKVDKSTILSLDNLQKKHEETFTMSEAYVKYEDEFLSFRVYDKLPKTNQNEFVQEMIEFAYDASQDPEEYGELEEVLVPYSLVLAIEKFTDIEVPEDNEKKIIYAGYLADFDLLGKILDTIDTELLGEMMDEVNESMDLYMKRFSEVLEKYQSDSGEIEDLSSLRLVEQELEKEESKTE